MLLIRTWGYVLPRAAVFARVVYSFCARFEENVFERIAVQVHPEAQRQIHEVSEGNQRFVIVSPERVSGARNSANDLRRCFCPHPFRKQSFDAAPAMLFRDQFDGELAVTR